MVRGAAMKRSLIVRKSGIRKADVLPQPFGSSQAAVQTPAPSGSGGESRPDQALAAGSQITGSPPAVNGDPEPGESETSKPRSARYFGTVREVDAVQVHDGVRKVRLLLDAVPHTALAKASQRREAYRPRPTPYLLLEVLQQSEVVTSLLNESGWLNFTLSEGNPGEGSIPVQTFSLSAEDEPSLRLWLTEPSAATAAEVQASEVLWPRTNITRRHVPPRPWAVKGDPPARYCVAVYDVGQASMGAVVDQFEHPVAYLDMAGPWASTRSPCGKSRTSNCSQAIRRTRHR